MNAQNAQFIGAQVLEAALSEHLRKIHPKIEFSDRFECRRFASSPRNQICMSVEEVHAKKWWTVSLSRGEEVDVRTFHQALMTTHDFLSTACPDNMCYPRMGHAIAHSDEIKVVYTNNSYTCWLAVPPHTAKDFDAFYPNAQPR